MMQAHIVLLAVQENTRMSTRMRMAWTRSSRTTAIQSDVDLENMHLVSKRHHQLMHSPSLQMPELETATSRPWQADCFENEHNTMSPTTLAAHGADIASEYAVLRDLTHGDQNNTGHSARAACRPSASTIAAWAPRTMARTAHRSQRWRAPFLS